MANTRLIEEYIRDSGYKLRHVARALNISESALHSKLQGQTQFKLNEAENLSAMLGMTPRTAMSAAWPLQKGESRNDKTTA